MFCAFQGPPKIVRIHGYAMPITAEDPRYAEFVELFPANPGTRAGVHIRVDRVSDSCGYSVPLYQFQSQRETLDRWASTKTPEGLKAYRATKNRQNIDGLPALLQNPHRNERNVVRLPLSAGMTANPIHNILAQFLGCSLSEGCKSLKQSIVAELLLVFVLRFRDAIAEDQQPVSGKELNPVFKRRQSRQ